MTCFATAPDDSFEDSEWVTVHPKKRNRPSPPPPPSGQLRKRTTSDSGLLRPHPQSQKRRSTSECHSMPSTSRGEWKRSTGQTATPIAASTSYSGEKKRREDQERRFINLNQKQGQFHEDMEGIYQDLKFGKCTIGAAFRALEKTSNEFNKQLDDDVLDLHYLPTSIAMKVLEKKIQEIKAKPLPIVLHVCTGVGNGSPNGVPVIKTDVIQMAKARGIQCSEMALSKGVLVLRFTPASA